MGRPPPPDDLVAAVRPLLGSEVVGWAGWEMALRESGPDGAPRFADPAVRCIQIGLSMQVTTTAGLLSVRTRQLDTSWELEATLGVSATSGGDEGSYRWRALPELPLGELTAATLLLDEDGHAERLLLRVGSRDVLLVAGELEEAHGRSLEYVRGDESVLVFADPADADRIAWRPPAGRFTPVRIDPALRSGRPRDEEERPR